VALDQSTTIGVVGSGAMGTGIAQVAAAAGHRVVLGDSASGAVQRAQARLAGDMDRLVGKQKLTRDEADRLLANIDFQWGRLEDYGAYRGCGLVIEAVVEDLDAKRSLLRGLESVTSPEAVLATNTSSLSITSLAAGCAHPQRVIGLHFFNPPPVMPLVEVVPWVGSDPVVATSAFALMRAWQKSPVLASDTPGFIVNRVARPFYGEAIRILEEGMADAATIDAAMKQLGGFRMGPFELMDFIGNDVNLAVTKSVFKSFFYDPRYRPSLTQQRLVEAGFLGRKSGRGYYDYAAGASRPEPSADAGVRQAVFDRVLVMLINEAVDAVFMRVASAADIDLAMTKGVNYPKGLLAWGQEIGLPRVLEAIEDLYRTYGEDRYRPSPLLRRMAADGTRFFD
jgi:3-hydroxybutyryl-CoA dehydrogenase